MNATQKEIARAADKITEAMNIIDKVAEQNGMRLRYEKEENPKDPFTRDMAKVVAEMTGKDFSCVYEILSTAFTLIEGEDDDDEE